MKLENLKTQHYVGIGVFLLALMLLWPNMASNFFRTQGYEPHGHCYVWDTSLTTLMTTADTIIGLSYMNIALFLYVFVRRTRGLVPFHWLFIAFAVFIFACGLTHFTDVLTIYVPAYWTAGYVRLVTMMASIITALALPGALPKIVSVLRAASQSQRQRNDYLNLLQKITVAANEATTIREPLQRTLQLVCNTLNLPVGHVYAPSDETPDIIEPTMLWYLDFPEKYEAFKSVTQKEAFNPDVGIIAQVVTDSLPRWFTNIADQPNYVRAEVAREAGLKTAIFIPILSQNKIVGVFEFYSDRLIEPDGDLLDIMEQIGTQLGRVVERKLAETELQKSEALFRSLFESAPTGIVIIDQYGQIIMLNENTQRMFGYAHEELKGESIELLLPERLRAIHNEHRGGFFTAPQTREMGVGFDLVGRQKDGTELPIEVGLSYIQTNEGLLAIGFITDISERVKTAQALQERENTLALSLQAARAGVWSWNIASGEIVWDETMERIHGLKVGSFGGTYEHWRERVHPDDVDRAEQAVQAALDDVRPFDTEFRVIWPDGSVHYILGQAIVPRDSNNKPVRMIGFNIDITKRKKAEYKLQRLNEELEQRVKERTAHLVAVNQELEAFSYSVSHDLRAPLRAIDGFSQALLEDYYDTLDDMGRDFLNRVRNESQRMGRLIDDLIGLSRYTRSEMHPTNLNLSEIVHEIVNEMESKEPDRQIEFVIQDNIIACGDESLIRAMLQNLIQNAWKYTSKQAHARIEFGATHKDGITEYYVRDNGAGFDMAYVNKLFGAFQRLHSMNEFEGTGIGLATVKRIVHRHGGTVRAEGEVNKGATFYFTLDEGRCI